MVKGCDRILVVPTVSQTKLSNVLLKLGYSKPEIEAGILRLACSTQPTHASKSKVK